MTSDLNAEKLSAFGKKIGDILNGASAALMISIGHKVRLFDAMSEIGPCSSEQLAEFSKLNERYVREWLAAMTTAEIISYDAFRDLYILPKEHAAMLTRAAGPRHQSL